MGVSTYDDVVVGAGHNGLTAAAYLARAGRRVLVLERLGHVGGAAVSAAPFPGVEARLSRYAYLVSLLPRRVVEDLDLDVRDRDVLIVEDVIDTGLTLNYLVRAFELREPRSVAVVTLLDRPYRRLVDDLPVRYVGFVVPDELFVGYGFDLDERYRELPDLRLLTLAPQVDSAKEI